MCASESEIMKKSEFFNFLCPETMSDASDYEVRIRQLSDELRRRRKEVEILKKERSRRKKEKFKAQEVALKKQLDVSKYLPSLLSSAPTSTGHQFPAVRLLRSSPIVLLLLSVVSKDTRLKDYQVSCFCSDTVNQKSHVPALIL